MLNLLIKPASSLCNMRCKYCYYHDESERRAVAFRGIMTSETAETLIRRAFEYDSRGVLFAFQGGEPTLAGLDFFRAFTASVKKLNKKNAAVRYSLQTNGLAIDGEWADFLRGNAFLTGLSLDGGRKIHNAMRVGSGGRGTYGDVLAAAKALRRRGAEFNILTVVTPETVRNIEKTYKALKRGGFRHLQFIPCLNPLDCREVLPFTLTDADHAVFLERLFALWYDDFMRGDFYSVRYFDNLLFAYAGQGAEQCGMQGRCGIQFVVESDGSVYPCDFYCLDEYLLGNISKSGFRELRASRAARAFVSDSAGVPPRCRGCEAYRLCAGGCRRYNSDGAYIYCESFKKFYKSSLPKLKAIAARLGLNPKNAPKTRGYCR